MSLPRALSTCTISRALVPLSFESLCAILYSGITARKSLAVSSSPLLHSPQQGVHAGSSCCQSWLVLPQKAAAAFNIWSVVWCFCCEEEGGDGSLACDLLCPVCAICRESKASHMLKMSSFWFDYFLCTWLMVNCKGELVLARKEPV